MTANKDNVESLVAGTVDQICLRPTSETHADLAFARVIPRPNARLATSLGATSIPMLMILRHGPLAWRQWGVPASALGELISDVRALDGVDISPRLAESEAAP